MEKREHKNHFALCLSNDEFHILKEKFIDSNMKEESVFLRHLIIYVFVYEIRYQNFRNIML